MDRRQFLKTSLTGLGSLCASAWARSLWAQAASSAESAAPAVPASAVAAGAAEKAIVYEINEPKLLDKFGGVDENLYLPGVLNRLLREMTGQRQTRDAWRKFLTDNDTIGIKFDPIAAEEIKTSTAFCRVLVRSLTDAGFRREKIVLIEPPPFTAALETGKAPTGYQEAAVAAGKGPDGKERTTQFLEVMKTVTAIVNVPFIKDDRLMGLSSGMVNLGLGLISNPGVFFDKGGDPGVAQLNALDPIRKKLRLTITNAIRGIYDGGPRGQDAKMWDQCSLVAGSDLVAVDRLALDILDTARYAQGLKGLAESGRPADYLKTAARMDLGEAELTHIDIHRVSI